MWAVVAGHAADLWGVVLVTAGVLAAVAFYANSLGPAGHDARLALGDVLGWGRFLVPPVAIAVGILLIVGRREGEEEGRSTPEPARAVIGASLTLLSVAGLASLAGGSPRFGASTTSLSSAGGWVGALIGNPLRSALGGFGAATVLVAMLVAAMVLFTGVSVSSAVGAAVRATRWSAALARGGSAGEDEEADEDEPTDPFGRAVSTRTNEAAEEEAEEEEEGAEPPFDEVVADPVVSDPEPPDPEALPEAATRPGKGAQLEMKLGPTVGDWRLPPSNLLKRAKPQAIDEKEVDAAGSALVSALAAHGVETRLVGRTVGPTVTRYELELGAGVKVARVTSASPRTSPTPWRRPTCASWPRSRASRPSASRCPTATASSWRSATSSARPRRPAATHPLEVALGRDIAGRAVWSTWPKCRTCSFGRHRVGQVVVHQLDHHVDPHPRPRPTRCA